MLTLGLSLESILNPGLCGDNHPLITVINLLVGQDNSCSAGDVDLRKKTRQRKKKKKVRQLKINDANKITSLEIWEFYKFSPPPPFFYFYF